MKILNSRLVVNSVLCFVVVLAAFSDGCAQYFVNFEGSTETKGAYAVDDIYLSGLLWELDETLIGTVANDCKNGNRAARMRDGSMTMLSDKANGLGEISFQYCRYGSDGPYSARVEYSIDAGVSWTQIGVDIEAETTTQTFSESVNVAGSVRVRILKISGGATNRMNVDDIQITDFIDLPPETYLITCQGFETSGCNDWGYTASGTVVADNPKSGDFCYQVGGDGINTVVTFDNVDITGLEDVTFEISLRSDPGVGSGPGWDTPESVMLEYSPDNGTTWVNFAFFSGGADYTADWSTGQLGFDNDDSGCPGSELPRCGTYSGPFGICLSAGSSTSTEYSFNNPMIFQVPNGINQVMFRSRLVDTDGATSTFNRSDEFYYIDDVRLTTSTDTDALPVTWLSFHANKNDQAVQLEWQTAMEINNEGFEVQRSLNGIDFEKIGWVEGNGTTLMTSAYTFRDASPQKGLNYYRLKQVDFDGEHDLSTVKDIVFSDSNEGGFIFKKHYQQSDLVVEFETQLYAQFYLLTAQGKIVDDKPSSCQGSCRVRFNTDKLPTGIYVVKVISEDQVYHKKLFIK